MRHINITQLPYSDFSHPNGALDLAGIDGGVDFWFSQGRWKCIGGAWGSNTFFFTAVDSSNNPTAVYCADGVRRIVTVALTHSNMIYTSPHVGEVYNDGDPFYEEGTYGKATGNHIHVEVASGLQTSKHYDAEMGCFRMPMELDPVGVFYVNDSFSDVISSHGAVLKHCDSVEHDPEGTDMDEEIIIKRISYADRLIVGTVDGNRFGTLYDKTVLAGFSDKGLIASGGREIACVNGSIFYTYNGATYAEGLEKSRGINNQSGEMSCVYTFDECMSIGFRREGGITFAKQKDIEAQLDMYYGAITGAFGIMLNGEKCYWGSELEAQRNHCFSTRSGRTIIGRSSDTKEILIISTPGITGKSGFTGTELYEVCRKAGCTDAICLDGGGSRMLRFNSETIVNLGRAVKNAVLFYDMGEVKDEEIQTDPGNDDLCEAQERNAELLQENTDLKIENAKLKQKLQQIKELADNG